MEETLGDENRKKNQEMKDCQRTESSKTVDSNRGQREKEASSRVRCVMAKMAKDTTQWNAPSVESVSIP